MKKKSIFTVTAVSLLALLLLFVFGGCGHPRRAAYRGKNWENRVVRRMDFEVEKLDLTDEQQEKYNSLRGKMIDDLTFHLAEQEKMFYQIRRDLDSDNPDMRAIGDQVKRSVDERASLTTSIDYFVEFYEMLNDEQKEIVLERMREHMDRPRGYHGRYYNRS